MSTAEQSTSSSLAGLSRTIFSEVIENAIQDIAAEAYRQHKLQLKEGGATSSRQSDSLFSIPRKPSSSSFSDSTSNNVICPNCRLPRIDDTNPVNFDGGKRYCSRTSYVLPTSATCDIYGTSFDGGAVKKAKKSEKDLGVGSRMDESRPSTPTLRAKEAPGSYWKCTECGSEISGQRFAAHLEKCLGLSGRKARRN